MAKFIEVQTADAGVKLINVEHITAASNDGSGRIKCIISANGNLINLTNTYEEIKEMLVEGKVPRYEPVMSEL